MLGGEGQCSGTHVCAAPKFVQLEDQVLNSQCESLTTQAVCCIEWARIQTVR